MDAMTSSLSANTAWQTGKEPFRSSCLTRETKGSPPCGILEMALVIRSNGSAFGGWMTSGASEPHSESSKLTWRAANSKCCGELKDCLQGNDRTSFVNSTK